MELEFSSDQEDLRDSIRAVLAKESPVSLARAVVETGASPGALWTTVTGLGWPALTVPEECGGIGLGAIEAGILAEELGRVIAPGALLPTVTQFVPMVREAGNAQQQQRFLGAVASGEIAGTLAITAADGDDDPSGVTTTATLDGDGVVLTGTKRFVMEAAAADEIAIVARLEGTTGDDGVLVAVVPRADVALEPVQSFDASRTVADVVLDGTRVASDRVLGAPGARLAHAVRRAMEEATVSLALETVGTCQSIFDITLEYVKQRQQFGVPIGSFQAIKHKFADMLVVLERARATGYYAALTIAEDDPGRTLAAAVAKAAAGDCQRLLGKEGIQIHGGIGYTWEHDMHLYVKRAKANDAFFGNTAVQRSRIATLLGI